MTKQIKNLILVLIGIAFLAGGFLIYKQSSYQGLPKPQPQGVSPQPATLPEDNLPKLHIAAPSEIEVTAFRPSSMDVEIKNEGGGEARDVNITLRGATGKVDLTNVTIFPGKSEQFKISLDKLGPGDYILYLDITGKPKVNITHTVLIKSRIVVGLDSYHVGGELYGPDIWAGNYYEAEFAEYLRKNGIKTKIIKSELTPELLSITNVLIIVTPEQPFSRSEKRAIKKFLDKEGGLLLVGTGGGLDENFFNFLNDLATSLHLRAKFSRSQGYIQKGWTTEITKHPITSGIEKIWWEGGYPLEVQTPVTPLVKKEGGTIYAIQHYSCGKIAIVRDTSLLRVKPGTIYEPENPQRNQLNLNLIKWLATPEVYEEMG